MVNARKQRGKAQFQKKKDKAESDQTHKDRDQKRKNKTRAPSETLQMSRGQCKLERKLLRFVDDPCCGRFESS